MSLKANTRTRTEQTVFAVTITGHLLYGGGENMIIKSITRCGKADVFNMEVDETHDFIIQGGVVSHNCSDEARYFCMMRPVKPRQAPIPDTYNSSPLKMYLDIDKKDLTPRYNPAPRMEVYERSD